jgi:hypothetical protein
VKAQKCQLQWFFCVCIHSQWVQSESKPREINGHAQWSLKLKRRFSIKRDERAQAVNAPAPLCLGPGRSGPEECTSLVCKKLDPI